MQINKKDIISFEMVTSFYYKGCEVKLKKFNQITTIKITGLSDMGNLLTDYKPFIEKINKTKLANYLCKREIKNIKKVYKSVVNKEYNNHDNFHLKKI